MRVKNIYYLLEEDGTEEQLQNKYRATKRNLRPVLNILSNFKPYTALIDLFSPLNYH